MESVFVGLIVVAVTTSFAVGGFLVFRKTVKADYLRKHHDIADPMMSLLGTLYSVLLGLLVAGAVERFDESRKLVHAEANAIADVFRLAHGLPQRNCDAIRNLCNEYCQVMVEKEWPEMNVTHKLSEAGWVTSEKLWQECLKIEASDSRVSNIHAAILQATAVAGESRRERAISVGLDLSPSLWLVTVFGSIIIIFFTYLFSAEKTALQCVMIAMVSASLALNVFLMVIFSHPFSGVVRIPPNAFRLNAEIFAHHGSATHIKPE